MRTAWGYNSYKWSYNLTYKGYGRYTLWLPIKKPSGSNPQLPINLGLRKIPTNDLGRWAPSPAINGV